MAEIFGVDEEVLTQAIRDAVKRLETAKNKPFDVHCDKQDPPFSIFVWFDKEPPQAVHLKIQVH